VAVAAGAVGDDVERVATMIVEARNITLDAAQEALSVLLVPCSSEDLEEETVDCG
jgi:hypothetical protein